MATSPIISRISDFHDPVTGLDDVADGTAGGPSFSPDGRFVAYASLASNIGFDLAAGQRLVDPDSASDIYLYMVDGGYNVLLTLSSDTPDVLLADGRRYTASNLEPVVGPLRSRDPATGETTYLVAFVTDSAGTLAGSSDPATSDGSLDLAMVSVVLRPAPAGSPYPTLARREDLQIGHGDEDVTGALSFAGNGQSIAYVASDGAVLRTLPVGPIGATGPSEIRLTAMNGAIGGVSVSHDGNLVAFDSTASRFDLDHNGSPDVIFNDADTYSNVFVLNLAAQTITRLTDDSPQSPASAQGGYVGAFVPDPTGTLAPRLSVVSIADPVTQAPLASSQAMLYTLTAGAWSGEIVSVTAFGDPASGPNGSLFATAGASAGNTWVGFTSDAEDLPGAPQWGQPSASPVQGWLGAPGKAPVLLTPGDPNSGYGGADADVLDLALAPVSYDPVDARMLLGQTGSFQLASFTTAATNLFGLLALGGIDSVYLATAGAPVPVLSRLVTLDYTPGGPLNPFVGGSILPSVVFVSLDAITNQVFETYHDGSTASNTISTLAGRPYTAGDPLRLVSPPSGLYLLGDFDDEVVLPPVTQSPDVTIDGGGGFDKVMVPAGQQNTVMAELSHVEALVFDPGTSPGTISQAHLAAGPGGLPTLQIAGSPGADQLFLEIGPGTGARTTIDLNLLDLQGFDGTQGDRLQLEVRPDPFALAVHPFDVVAVPSLPLVLGAFAGTTVNVIGSDLADHLNGGYESDHLAAGSGDDLLIGGLGADVLDGGPGRDLAHYASLYAALPRPAPVQIDLADGLPEHGGAAEGDVLIGIEDLWGTDDDDRLLGGGDTNRIHGWMGGDEIDGRGGDDELFGDTGSDLLTGGPGNDLIVGGYSIDPVTDVDTAVFSGTRSDYLARSVDAGHGGPGIELTDLRAGSPDGVDTLVLIDQFRFSDGTYTREQLLPPLPEVRLQSSLVRVTEGSGPGTTMLYVVGERVGDLSGTTVIEVDFSGVSYVDPVTGESAVAATGGDLKLGVLPLTGEITLRPGDQLFTIAIELNRDALPEPTEAILLRMTGVTGGVFGDPATRQAVGLIMDDDAVVPPVFSFTNFRFPAAMEGTSPGEPSGVLDFVIQRESGDLQTASTLEFALMQGSEPAAVLADLGQVGGTEVTSLGAGRYRVVFPAGQQTLHIPVTPAADRVDEPDEWVTLELESTSAGSIGGQGFAAAQILDDDQPLQPPVLSGAAEVREGHAWSLTIAPQPAGVDAGAWQFQIDWGDGSSLQRVSGAELLTAHGVVAHTYADDAEGVLNRSTLNVQVTVTDPSTQQVAGRGIHVDVVDVAPTLSDFGFAASWVEHHVSTPLTIGTLSDVAGDPVLQMFIDWGDGPPQPRPAQGTMAHSYATLGSHRVKAIVVNDDGQFEVASTMLQVAATIGFAPPNGTPGQWVSAWTDSLMSISHKANAVDANELWTAVRLTAASAGLLNGGDLYAGLLGVSGRSVQSSTVAQDIDGAEALRVELLAGNRADALVVDLARLSPGLGVHEAARLQFFDGNTLVAERTLRALHNDGQLHADFSGLPLFTSVVFTAGAYDANGVFWYGGQVNDQGVYQPTPGSMDGSDYMVASLQFFDLPDVPLVGLPGGPGG